MIQFAHMIHNQLKEELKTAMKARDEIRLRTVRSLLAAFTNELVATKRKPTDPLPDEDALKVIKRASNQRKDSIEQFKKGGREDLVKTEEEELLILDGFLPKQLSADEIRVIVERKKAELGVTDKSGMGKLIGAVMAETKGAADGGEVKEIIDELLG